MTEKSSNDQRSLRDATDSSGDADDEFRGATHEGDDARDRHDREFERVLTDFYAD